MNRLTIISILLLAIVQAGAQVIARHEADSLIKLLDKKKSDTGKVNILLRLAEFHIFKPEERKPDLDTAETFLNKAMVLNASLKTPATAGYESLVASYLNKERKQADTAKVLAKKAIALLLESKDQIHLARAYEELAQYYNGKDSVKMQINLIEKAIEFNQLAGDIEQKAKNIKWLGEIYKNDGNPDKAIELYQIALDAFKSVNKKDVQNLYVLMGSAYNDKGNFRESMAFRLLALKTAESVGDTTEQLCQVNNHVGTLYIELEEIENAIPYFKHALTIAEKYNNNSNVVTVAYNMVNAYIKLGRPSAALDFLQSIPKRYLAPVNPGVEFVIPMLYLVIYTQLQKYDEAKLYSIRLLTLKDRYKDDNIVANMIYINLAKYYYAIKNYAAAKVYLAKNMEALVTIKSALKKSQHYLQWFKVDSAEGNYKAAINNLLKYNLLHDSVFNESKSKFAKQLEFQYETAKKSDSIKLAAQNIKLLQQQSLLQQREIKQTKMGRNGMIASAILLLLLLGVIFNRYRLKQRSNHLLQAQQTEITQKNAFLQHLVEEKEWLLKEVHHRVKNNLHTVICLLESQAAYLENDALKAIESSQHRIYAMSLIHQKLYQSEDIKTIDMSVYLPEFIHYLDESFDSDYKIQFRLEIEPLMLGVSQAIPIALIINEAVTNSIKYAFPQNRKGVIEISMHRVSDQIVLTIADNGIGINPVLANSPSKSLGLKLIKGLSEDINATINIENDHGTRINIEFSVDPLHESNNVLASAKEIEVYA